MVTSRSLVTNSLATVRKRDIREGAQVSVEYRDQTLKAASASSSFTMDRPAKCGDGDLLLAVIVAPPSQPSDQKKISTPAGWERIDQCLHVARYWKFVEAGENPKYIWDVAGTLGSASMWVGMMIAYSGVHTEVPIMAWSSQPVCEEGNVDEACKGKEGNPPSQCYPKGCKNLPAPGVSWNQGGGRLFGSWVSHDDAHPMTRPKYGLTERCNQKFLKRTAEYGVALLAADKSLGAPGETRGLAATPGNPSWRHGVAGLVVLRPADVRTGRRAKTKKKTKTTKRKKRRPRSG
jgi:hypothetical protein